MNQKCHKKPIFTVHILVKRPIRRILACSQLLEGVVSSQLLPIPGPTQPLLPYAQVSDPLGMPALPWVLLTAPLQGGPPEVAHIPYPSGIIPAQPQSLLIQTFPQLFPVLCSVSLLIRMGKPLSMTVFPIPRGNHYLFPKGNLFYSLTFPQQLPLQYAAGLFKEESQNPRDKVLGTGQKFSVHRMSFLTSFLGDFVSRASLRTTAFIHRKGISL